MANIHWTLGVNGFFQDPLHWSTNTAPGAADNAVIDAAGTYTVVLQSGVLGLPLGGTQTVGGIQTSSNATLQIVGDIDVLDLLAGDTTLIAVNGAGGGANAGKIVIQDAVFVVPVLGALLGASARLQFGGTFNNTGTIVLNGQPHLLGLLDADQTTYLTVDKNGGVLTGGGHVTLSNERLNIINGSTLTNVNNTISGSGAIEPSALINQAAGVIDANQSTDLVVAATITTNTGLIESTTHGSLILTRTIDNAGGVVEANGGRISLQTVDIVGGTVESVGLGLVLTNSRGGVLDGRASALTIIGDVIIHHGDNLTIDGSIDNTGKLLVSSTIPHPDITDLIVGAGGATLTGGGQVNLTQITVNRIYGVSSGTTLTNVDNRISGAGQLGNGTLNLVNDAAGIIVGNQSVGLTINTGSNAITNAGLITSQSGGVVTIAGAVNNTGVLEVHSGSVTVNGEVTGTGSAVIAAGTLYFASTFAENAVFGGGSGVLELARSQSYAGTVINFSHGGGTALDLRDIAFGGSTKATYSGTATTGTLTVTDGFHTAHIKLKGNYLSSHFKVSSDGHGGTTVVDPTAASAAHQFIAAAAALGAHPAAAASVARDTWQAHP
ncbi:MAG: hypothetical protein ABI306_06760, partial [Caulobacteraceae bacterium]